VAGSIVGALVIVGLVALGPGKMARRVPRMAADAVGERS
jgi:hypothetical protein